MKKKSAFADGLAPELDQRDYPRRWSEYIGQEPAKRMLQVAIKSAKVRKRPLDHVLIAHPSPGIGKTALANLVGVAMGKTPRILSGACGPTKIRMIFSQMSDNDVLVYDEFHQVMDKGRKDAEWLLDYLEKGTVPGPLGPEVQPKVTIVAATTDAGRLPETIVGRFPNQPPMTEYNSVEATKIAALAGKGILGEFELPMLSKKAALAIATASSHNPRAMKRLLVVLRDMTITDEIPLLKGGYNIDALLESQGITHDGLDRVAQKYLETLAFEFAGSAGARNLEDRLQQAGGLASTERLLMDKGLVAKTRTGRALTQAGIGRVNDLVA